MEILGGDTTPPITIFLKPSILPEQKNYLKKSFAMHISLIKHFKTKIR